MARRVHRVSVQPGDAFFIPGDLHFPECNEAALRVAWDWFYARNRRARYGAVLQGDSLETHALSTHEKDLRRGLLMDEVRTFSAWAEEFGDTPLGCRMILGNHEARAARTILNLAPGLLGTPGTEFARLTGLEDVAGLTVHGHKDQVLLGPKVVVEHGDAMRGGKTGNKKPASVLNDYPDQTTIYGHTHAAAVSYRTVYGPDGQGTRAAINVGTFQRIESAEDFAPDPNWQVAFAEVKFLPRGLFSAKLHLVLPDAKAEGGYVVV